MVKGFFGNLKKFWRCRRNFGGVGRKTLSGAWVDVGAVR